MAVEKIAIDIDSNAKEIQKELSKVNVQLKKLQKQLPSIQKNVEKLKKAEQSVKAINNQLKKLSSQKAKLQTDTSQLDYTAKKISNVTLQMNRLQARKVKLLVSIEQLLHAEAVLARLNRELDYLNGRRAVLTIEVNGLQEALSGIDLLSEKLQQLSGLQTISLPSLKGEINMNIQTKMDFDMDILVSKVAELKSLKEISISIQKASKDIEQIEKNAPSNLGSLLSKLLVMGAAIVGMGLLVGIAGALVVAFPAAAIAGFATIKLIGVLLEETAKTMEQIDAKVPSDFGSMMSKLGSMGIALLGMGALVALAGGLSSKFSDEATAGLKMIKDIIGLLGETAEAMEIINEKVPSDFGSMISKLASMGLAILGMGALVVIADLVATKFKGAEAGLKLVSEITDLLGKAADAMGAIDKKVPSGFGSMIDKLGNMGIAIVGMGALVVIAGAVATKFKGAQAGLKLIGGITDLLGKAADAMGAIDKKVPKDIGKVAEKMGSIGVAIGGMSVLVGVVGALTSSGIGALIAGAGLATVYAVAEELIHTSEAIRQLDQNVPEDIGTVKTKIENIAKAIGYFTESSLASAFDLFKTAMGTINTAIAAEGILKLIEVGEELKKFDTITIPDDIEAKINAIQDVFEYLKKGVGIVGEIKEFFLGGDIDTDIGEDAKLAIENLTAVAKSMAELEKVEIKDLDNIDTLIADIQAVFKVFDKTKGIGDDIAKFFVGGDTATKSAVDAQVYVQAMADIATEFEKLQNKNIKSTKIKEIITDIQSVFSVFLKEGNLLQKLGSVLFGRDIDTATASDAKKYVLDMATIAAELEKIQGVSFDIDTVRDKLQLIQDAVKEFEKVKFKIKLKSKELTDTVTKIGQVGDLIDKLDKIISFTFDDAALDRFKKTLENVSIAVQEVMTTDFSPDENLMKNIDQEAIEEVINNAIEKLRIINSMSQKLEKNLEFHFDLTKLGIFRENMENINEAVKEILAADFIPEGYLDSLIYGPVEEGKTRDGKLNSMIEVIENAIVKLDKINGLSEKLKTALSYKFEEADVKRISNNLEQLYEAVKVIHGADFTLGEESIGDQVAVSESFVDPYINKEPVAGGGINNTSSTGTTSSNSNTTNFITTITNIINKINKIDELRLALQKLIDEQVNKENLDTALANLENCLLAVQAFVAKTPDIGSVDLITSALEKINAMVDEMEKLATRFNDLGVNYATELLNGFASYGVPLGMSVNIVLGLIFLKVLNSSFTSIGKGYGEALVSGFGTGLEGLAGKISTEADTIKTNMAGSTDVTKFQDMGAILGNALVAGFESAVDGLYVKMSAADGSVPDVKKTIYEASGGLVPEYHARGGLAGIFKKKGTDTVPAMLTPGEFIQKRAAVKTFGVDFMKRVNNLDIRGAFNAMTNRFGFEGMAPAVSTVVNNINHTTNNANRVTQNVAGGNPNYIMKRASRYLR